MPLGLPWELRQAVVNSNQAAFPPTKMWRVGRATGSTSSRPAGINTIPPTSLGTGPPQEAQNQRSYAGGERTSGARYTRVLARPRSHRNDAKAT